MFNEERKRRYIDKKESEVELNQYFLTGLFTSTQKYEEKYNKDVCDWELKEILSYYRYYDTGSLFVLMNINSALGQYCNWCLSETLVSDGQNHFLELNNDLLSKCVNSRALSETIITLSDLNGMLWRLINTVDKFLLLAIFEGIKGDYYREILHMHIFDIDGNIVHLPDRDIKISNQLKEYAYKAAEETSYYIYTERDYAADLILDDKDLICKPTVRTRNFDDFHLCRNLSQRYKIISGFLELPSALTMNKIALSGKIEYIKGIMEREKLDLEDTLRKHRKEIDNQYPVDKIKSTSLFITKYGNFFK